MSRKRKPGRPKGSKSHLHRDLFEDEYAPFLSPQTKRAISVVLLLAVSVITILGLLGSAGVAGSYITIASHLLFGSAAWLAPIILLFVTYLLIVQERYAIGFINYFGVLLFALTLTGLLHLRVPVEQAIDTAWAGLGGGLAGVALAWPLATLLGIWAA
ncbi:MAG: DNA translocase FtsK 4TM domain-containing protein, partial [Patescibacteria group bacterium]